MIPVCNAQTSTSTSTSDTPAQTISIPEAKGDKFIESNAKDNNFSEKAPVSTSESDESETFNKDFTGIRLKSRSDFNPIEKMFGSGLRQFGYNLLGKSAGLTLAGTTSPGYKLTKGDKLIVYLWGDTLALLNMTGNKVFDPITKLLVDDTGSLFIPNIGLLKVEGLTVSQAERSLASAIGNMYSGIEIRLTLDDPRAFPIYVIGNVGNPGVIYINSNCSFVDALNLAGGVTKIGSLRDITYINGSNKTKTSIDLYDFFIKGQLRNITVKKGDTILVKPIGKVVAISQGVKYPAIYEFKNNENLYDLVKIANGLLPNINTELIQIESYDKEHKQKIIKDLTLENLKKIVPSDGDVITFNSVYGKAENFVTLQGNIKMPVTVQYKTGMKLSDILKSRNDLLSNTFIDQAFIVRMEGLEKRSITVPFSLEDFFNGKIDPALQPMDSIFITTGSQMATVLIEGEVYNPGPIPLSNGMSLKSILPLVNLKGNSNDFVIEVKTGGGLKTVYLYSLLTKNNGEHNITFKAGDQLLFRYLTEKELLKTVSVIGYVKNPGVFKVKPGSKITDVINEAGGLTDEAFFKGMVFLRPGVAATQQEALNDYIIKIKEEIAQKEGSMLGIIDDMQKANLEEEIKKQQEMLEIVKEKFKKNYGRIVLDIKGNDLNSLSMIDNENLEIREGDEIIIPMKSDHVLVMGEVQNSSAIAFEPNKDVKYYINKVGGFTETAKKNRTLILKPDGSSERISGLGKIVVDPGSTIVVPKKHTNKISVTPKSKIFVDLINSAFQVSSTVFMMMNIRK